MKKKSVKVSGELYAYIVGVCACESKREKEREREIKENVEKKYPNDVNTSVAYFDSE